MSDADCMMVSDLAGDAGVMRAAHPFAGIRVRPARSQSELEQVYAVRYRGYAKYLHDPQSVREALDQSAACILLLATDVQDTPLGTMRLLDRRLGPIELDQYLDVDRLLPAAQQPVVEATRYSVPASPISKWVKLALCRAYFQYCHRSEAGSMLIWIRRSAEREYRRMLFEKVPNGSFSHPQLGALPHETWRLDVPSAPARYRSEARLLYRLLYEETHPEIRCK